MKARAVVGFTASALLIASAMAHAFLGWPALRSALAGWSIDSGIVGAVSVGWYFGSVAMLVFGVIVLQAALRMVRAREAATAPAGVIAVAYIAFGLSAFIARGLNPHFLLFVATGVLVGVFAFWRSS